MTTYRVDSSKYKTFITVNTMIPSDAFDHAAMHSEGAFTPSSNNQVTLVNEEKFNKFAAAYQQGFQDAIRATPHLYVWDTTNPAVVERVASKMLDAWRAGTASKDGPACAAACRALGIRHTVKAIRHFIGWEQA